MRIKKFTGKTFQDAFENVRKELGEDAVILNSRKTKPTSGSEQIHRQEIYEITAAIDKQNLLKEFRSSPPKNPKVYSPVGSSLNISQKTVPTINNKILSNHNSVNQKLHEQSEEIRQLHQDIREVKKTLNKVSDLIKFSSMPALPELFKSILKKLVENEVHEDLAKAIVQTVLTQTKPSDYQNPEIVTDHLLSLLSRMIKENKPLEKIEKKPYVVTLIGPTGVGKTTTIAKIAANLKLHHHKKVAIISADTYRIAAIEQLQTFANIANIPMDVVYSPEEMQGVIFKFRERDFILIDTVGRNQRNEQHVRELNKFIQKANPDEIHLVLSITSSLKNLLDVVRRFNIIQPNRLLFTKLDEAIYTGNILNVLYKHQMPVSYLTTGQVVPNDINIAYRKELVKMVCKGV
jgi:flagellar biosynthesis protein FlhF